jgi:glycosyltransferase involved in cell wall biosynthesis
MRFAVIEYTTKTGHIWRPTPERPNYLGDPQKEIDPTSFACYTTALKGEHIPLKGLILGTLSRQPSAVVTTAKKAIKRLAGSWPQWYSLQYLKAFDTLMVVHQLSDAHEVQRFVERLKRELPHIFVIGVPTQPFGLLKTHLETHPVEEKTFKQYLDQCDVFLTVVKSTRGWYESLTTTPVVYMPQPYPYHYAHQFFKARTDKQKKIFVAGVTQRPDIRKGQLVAKAIQQALPDYEIVVLKVPDLEYDETYLAGTRYALLPFEEWREHLHTLARVSLVINTDYTQTRGRVQTDCAAVGTPSLGADSDGQVDLFPDLASTPVTSVEELAQAGARLLKDAAWYDQLTRDARERLQKYDYDESAARVQALVKTYRALHA